MLLGIVYLGNSCNGPVTLAPPDRSPPFLNASPLLLVPLLISMHCKGPLGTQLYNGNAIWGRSVPTRGHVAHIQCLLLFPRAFKCSSWSIVVAGLWLFWTVCRVETGWCHCRDQLGRTGTYRTLNKAGWVHRGLGKQGLWAYCMHL